MRETKRPAVKFLFIARRRHPSSLVPCFSFAEVVLLEHWARENGVEFNTYQNGPTLPFSAYPPTIALDPGLIYLAAEYGQSRGWKLKPRYAGKKNADVRATIRKLLKPKWRRNGLELRQEQERNLYPCLTSQ